MPRRLLGRPVGRQARIGIGRHVLRRQAARQLDQGSNAGQQILGIAAIGIDAGELALRRVHVVAAPAGEAMAAGDQRMADHRIADLEALDARADLLDPAGILMPHDIGKLHIHLAAPDALDDVQVGAANAGATDADDDVGGLLDLRVGDFLVPDELRAGQRWIEFIKHGRLHGRLSLDAGFLVGTDIHKGNRRARAPIGGILPFPTMSL